jgi:DNA-binding XRE family transcriptional regulator
MRQLDLASDAENSPKRLGVMEAGRLKPSWGLLLHLAACLDVPLRQKNALLSAALFDSLFEEHAFHVPALDIFRRGIETVLAAHDSCPALVVDRHWTMLRRTGGRASGGRRGTLATASSCQRRAVVPTFSWIGFAFWSIQPSGAPI